MNTTDKIMEILQSDPKAKKLLNILNEVSREHNPSDHDYELARAMVIEMAMIQNKEIAALLQQA